MPFFQLYGKNISRNEIPIQFISEDYRIVYLKGNRIASSIRLLTNLPMIVECKFISEMFVSKSFKSFKRMFGTHCIRYT